MGKIQVSGNFLESRFLFLKYERIQYDIKQNVMLPMIFKLTCYRKNHQPNIFPAFSSGNRFPRNMQDYNPQTLSKPHRRASFEEKGGLACGSAFEYLTIGLWGLINMSSLQVCFNLCSTKKLPTLMHLSRKNVWLSEAIIIFLQTHVCSACPNDTLSTDYVRTSLLYLINALITLCKGYCNTVTVCLC